MKSTSKWFITFVIRPNNTMKHVFSKSVSYMSKGLNSTLHPIVEDYEGGGLNLIEFQFVDWIFSKCMVISLSLI